MCAAPKQNIDVHLPRRYQQTVAIAGWYDCVAVCKAYAQTPVCDDF
jgi:hypothetical protein